MQTPRSHPLFLQVVLDTTNARSLAEFYRQLLGYVYRPGHELPPAGQPDEKGKDWLIIEDPSGRPRIAFQQVAALPRSTWPDPNVPQQLHFDFMVHSMQEFEEQHQRALSLGAEVLHDRSQDPEEPLRVYADPSGHPFCIFVGPAQPLSTTT
jgi:hypothetical protein